MTTSPGWFLKNIVDRVTAAVLLAMLLPLICLIMLAIMLDDGRPVFFAQSRAGLHARTFFIMKFRTMRVGWQNRDRYDAAGRDQRYTRIGPLLRRVGLDEIPQLVNVLRGDMSLIGPRPCLPYQAKAMSPAQRRRFLVRPGISGWAQVHGRWSIPWSHKIELDLWYIDHWSLWLDIRIAWLSVIVLTRGRGLHRLTREEMEDFR